MTDTSPNSMWFYAENDERKGPIPFSQLQEKFLNNLPDTALVWTEGMGDWVPAKVINGLTSPNTNPYAAPTSANPTQTTLSETELEIPNPPVPLGIIYSLHQGFKYTLSDFSRIFVFGLVFIGISMVMSFVIQIISGPPTINYHQIGDTVIPQTQQSPVAIVLSLISNLVSIWLGLGAIRWGHKFLNGEKPEISELFGQGSKFLPALGASILFGIMLIVGTLLFIVPGIIVFLRFSFFQQAIVEKNLGVIDSLKYSWELTKTNTINLLGLSILSGFVFLAGLLCLVVGLVVAIPTIFLANLIAFRYLHRGKNAVIELP